MLTKEMNDRIARVGPGTPGGELMRRYWIPFLPAAKLDEDPVHKVRILGEDLTVYRDKSGNLGLIGDRCLHRSVEMQYGIPDVDGLRCPYHGWKYDSTGACIDTPLEASDSHFKEKLHMKAYPVQELGGLLFAYMGPLPAPILPRWDLYVWPNAIRQIGISELNCNWLQCQENTGDPTHDIYLHGYLYRYELEKMGGQEERIAELGDRFIQGDRGIKGIYVSPTQYGLEKGIVYSKALGAAKDYISRHSTVIFPFYTHTSVAGSPNSGFQIRVPIDDTHTYHIMYSCYSAPPGVEVAKQDSVPYYEIPIWDGHGKPILDTVLNGDMIGWWSQGPLTDRSKEKLGRTDIPIIFMRRQIDQQIKIVEEGGDPMNVFRDPATTPDVLHGNGRSPDDWIAPDWPMRLAAAESGDSGANFRRTAGATSRDWGANFHKGHYLKQMTDRYGPASPLVVELHRRIEQARERALASS